MRGVSYLERIQAGIANPGPHRCSDKDVHTPPFFDVKLNY